MNTPSQQQLEQQARLALMHAARLAPDESQMSIAGRVYDDESALMGKLRRPWMVERLLHMLQQMHRRDRQKPNKQQMTLPLPGLEEIPPKLTFTERDKKQRVALQDATLPQLRTYRRSVAKTHERELAELDRLIAFMTEHVPLNKRSKLTVREVLGQHRFDFGTAAMAAK